MQLPHLQHTFKEFEDWDGLKILSQAAKTDLILSLVEASRFSNIEWKRCAIALAKKGLQQVGDYYLHACVAHRDSTICRILGDTDHSALALSSFAFDNCQHKFSPRMNTELGWLALQSAINHIHNEELPKAIRELRTWQPLSAASPSKAERIVLYHTNIWQGRALRYQGQFSESLICLQKADLGSKHEESLEDARPGFICDLGDVYCELGNSSYAEHLLDKEMKRLDDRGAKNSKDWYLLQLSRAESLMGQERFEEAEALCLEIQPYPRLSKLDSLRLSIFFGRIYHQRSDWSNARHYWTKALSDIYKFPLVNGHTTKAILHSMKEVLLREGNLEWSSKYNDQINKMKVIKPGGCEYWIPGLGRWYNSLNRPSERL